MKTLISLIIICILGLPVQAQNTWQEIIEQKTPEHLQMSSMLWQICTYGVSDEQAARQKALSSRMKTREDGKILVEVVRRERPKQAIDVAKLTALGIEVESTWKWRAKCWVSLTDCIAQVEKLPTGYVMEHVSMPRLDNQGPGLMNSQDFINNGADGSGIRIGIIDHGYQQLTNAQAAAAAPTVTSRNYTSDPIESETRHGTGCLETVFDHAPGATYFIYKIDHNATDFGNAIDDARLVDNIDIISHSLPWYNTGWNDNSGDICAAVSDATSSGILFFTSSGNRNGTHWQGTFNDADSDDWHQWSGGDEENDFTVNSGGEVSLYLQWQGEPHWADNDYDLYLRRDSDDAILASSTSGGSYEDVYWENTGASSVDVYVAVKQDGASTVPLEVFNHDHGCTGFQYASTNGSTTSPSNSSQANCISVGAVSRTDYTSLPGTAGILASYSSRGPTNGGALTPDVVAPTNTTTVAYGGNFGGTSCATPNAAGMAAAFWSEHDNLSASGVRMLIFRQAQLYNDWGDSGNDYLYGRGGLEIYDWINNSRFIYYAGNNVGGSSSLPYRTIEQADLLGPTNYTMIFLGEVIPAPSPGTIIDKRMLYMSPMKTTEIEN